MDRRLVLFLLPGRGGLLRGARPCGLRATSRGGSGLTRERLSRGGPVPFPAERLPRRSGPRRRRLATALAAADVARGLPPRLLRGRPLPGWPESHSGPARLRQTDRDRLLGRAGAVLSLADVMHLLAHELPGLRARRLPLAPVFLGA